MISWDQENLRTGPFIIHLKDIEDHAVTKQIVDFLRKKKAALQRTKIGYSCQYPPHRLLAELRRQNITCTSYTTLDRRAYWTFS